MASKSLDGQRPSWPHVLRQNPNGYTLSITCLKRVGERCDSHERWKHVCLVDTEPDCVQSILLSWIVAAHQLSGLIVRLVFGTSNAALGTPAAPATPIPM